MPNRLDSISSVLSDLFEGASESQQRRAVFAACKKAISDNALTGQEIDLAIDLLMVGGSGQPLVRSELNQLSQKFDETYFELSDEDDPSKAELAVFFMKARATAAVAFALSANADDWCEAIYEAISATDDRAGIMQIAENELKAR